MLTELVHIDVECHLTSDGVETCDVILAVDEDIW